MKEGKKMSNQDRTNNALAGEELVRRVDAHTSRQVQDLQIHCDGSRVTVTGRSRTYYIKQLVTQAILGGMPSMQLRNEIAVY